MPQSRRLPTQHDVAREAGVSTATVSRVVNRNGVISTRVKDRVLKAIETLQYVPHASARALASQRSGTLGAIIPTLNSAIFAEGINAFESIARLQGYSTILSVSQWDKPCEQTLIMKMIEHGVDGLLLVGNLHDKSIFERLDRAGVKYVCTWAYNEHSPAPNVGFDNAEAMASLVDHLVGLGHQRFGMLAGYMRDNDRARDRVAGVKNQLATHGLELPDQHIIQVPYSVRESREAFWRAIDHNISALICSNDVQAFGALLEAQKLGLRVPEDISITGFDDLSLSAEMSPALTTVEVGAEMMGKTAARRLIAAIEKKTTVRSERLVTRLVVRETTGVCHLSNVG